MKDRILDYLNRFANGLPSDLTEELKRELGLDEQTFRQYAQETQAAILHHYDQFSISTIDAFFQRVIRSFTREAGLVGDYRLEVEHDNILEIVIDNLMDELGTNHELTEWVVEFARENLENERAWDVRASLIAFAGEIFREEFKEIEYKVMHLTADRTYFNNLRSTLLARKEAFLARISTPAKEALSIIQSHQWQATDFHFGKNSGLISFLERYAYSGNIKREPPGSRIREYFLVPGNWPHKTFRDPDVMIRVARDEVIPILHELIKRFDEEYEAAMSAEVILQNLYVFGLISDISRKLKEYKDENNLMLLADAPKFLQGVIQDSDTPFIYEKVGSFYRNYLIDEFQDTSEMQWKNFLPLLTNSLDQGSSSMVVGDVKQAIYRWRGGDLKLLQEDIEQNIGGERVATYELNANYRSDEVLVNFNNKIFEQAAADVSSLTGNLISLAAYKDVSQKSSRQLSGFVRVDFLQDQEDVKWREAALQAIPRQLEELQSAGVQLKDIAILVRKNDEGQQIVSELLRYKHSTSARQGYRYDVVSNESLRLDGAASVNLLLGAMRYLVNPDDVVARAQLAFEVARMSEPDRPLSDVFSVTPQPFFERSLPDAFVKDKAALKKLPLFELTETLISIFHLGDRTGELAYLTAFQNNVLEFYSRERNDLSAFLEWWEENKGKKSIQVSGAVNAAQILTIHKSKGLQFKFVIVPFCAWNLDHDAWQAPNLWVPVPDSIFPDASYVPVKYEKTLDNTYFKEAYQTERARTFLDNLNLLYVAFTRAEVGLMVKAPHPKSAIRNSIAQVLYRSIEAAYSDHAIWDGDKSLVIGSLFGGEGTQAIDTRAIQMNRYAASRWRDKLVIRKASTDRKTSYGLFVHAVLSRISYRDEIPGTLDSLRHEGTLTEEAATKLIEQLDLLLQNPQVATWFGPPWEVRTEVPILIPEGKEARIDRLLINGKHAVVIDFKTGEASSSDQQQVKEYMTILRKMNFTEVEGYILYLKDHRIVSVPSGRIRTASPKDKQQLDLF